MDDRSTAISAAEVADDRAEIAAAVKAAKAFRDKLEGIGISYHKLLALEEARRKRKSPPPWRGGGRHMAERNDMTAALVTAYTSPQLAAINEYLEAEKAVRAAAEMLGLDADLMIAEAEGLARATTFSNVEALYFVADQAASGKREVNGHA